MRRKSRGRWASQSCHEPPADFRSVNPLAYEALSKGRVSSLRYRETYSTRDLADAERRLGQALELDPTYTDALVESGELYRRAAFPPAGKQTELLSKATGFAGRALAIDALNGTAQGLRGAIDIDGGRPRRAVPYLLRGIALAPYDPDLRNYLHLAYMAMGFGNLLSLRLSGV